VVALRPPAPNPGRRSVSSGRDSASTNSGWLRDHFEQVLDEVEQARVRPLQILEDEHDSALLGKALEEESPGREEILPVGGRPLGQPEQVGEPRLQPRTLVRVGDVLLDGRPEPGERRVRGLLLEDP
jgi:hypothetical protein